MNPDTRTPPEPPTSVFAWIALLAIVAMTIILRGMAIDAGLPQQFRSAEESLHLERALRIAGGDLDPKFYIYPSLHFYLMGGALRVAHGDEVLDAPLGGFTPAFARTSRILSLGLG